MIPFFSRFQKSKNIFVLTHFCPMFPFYTPCFQRKQKGNIGQIWLNRFLFLWYSMIKPFRSFTSPGVLNVLNHECTKPQYKFDNKFSDKPINLYSNRYVFEYTALFAFCQVIKMEETKKR